MRKLIISLVAIIVLAGCVAQDDEAIRGRVLLWHSLSDETEQAVLNDVLDRFTDIYEDVTVITTSVPRDDLLTEFQEAAASGLGPDLMIGESLWIRDLARAELIKDLTPLDPRLDIYYSGAVASLRYRESPEDESQIYGLPFAMRPVALYYNTELVDTPATTLDQLLADAAAGNRVAINTSFISSYWGVSAFGGQLFNENGRAVLDEGGFANWLSWLNTAQSTPGVFLSRDEGAIVDLFLRERVAYMVATPDELLHVRQALGEERFSVAPLPSGPAGEAGPLLQVDAVMLNNASAHKQSEIALLLARFLTNSDQGGAFVRQTGIVPANRRVRVDPVAYPAVAGFRTQALTAVPIPNHSRMGTILAESDNLIIQVLEGVLAEAEAAREITVLANGDVVDNTVAATEVPCEVEGDLRVWHTLEGRSETTLQLIADSYMSRCAAVTVELLPQTPANNESLLDLVASTVDQPALLLGNGANVAQYVALNYTVPVESTVLQTYLPASVQQLTIDNQTYGIPFSVDVLGLYYNPQQIETVATSIEELRTQAGVEGRGLAMSLSFNDIYWGYTAFGGVPVDGDGNFEFDAEAWLQWLTWLDSMQTFESVMLSNDRNNLVSQFITDPDSDSSVAYYIGFPQDFADFEAALPADNFALTTLPDGTAGEPIPVLGTRAFYINNRLQERDIAIARDFALFATSAEQQQILLETTRMIPANVNLVLEEGDSFRPWLEQIQNAAPLPDIPEIGLLRTEGVIIIDTVVRGAISPVDGVIELGALFDIPVQIDESTGTIVVTEEATAEAE